MKIINRLRNKYSGRMLWGMLLYICVKWTLIFFFGSYAWGNMKGLF
ncbi:hypothetical protein BH24BAC1_BH24BAC1_12100 [soil metagenome]|jgi:hypothetical protein